MSNSTEFAKLLSMSDEGRDESWAIKVGEEVQRAELFISQHLIHGPDSFPYIDAYTWPGEGHERSTPFSKVLDMCCGNGSGLVINKNSKPLGFVFHFGDMWSFKIHSRFIINPKELLSAFSLLNCSLAKTGSSVVKIKGDSGAINLVAHPGEEILPSFARKILETYLGKLLNIQAQSNDFVFLHFEESERPLAFNFPMTLVQGNEATFFQNTKSFRWFVPRHFDVYALYQGQFCKV